MLIRVGTIFKGIGKVRSRSKFTTRAHACIKSRSVKVEIPQNNFIVSGWAVGRFKQVRQ